MKIVIEIICKKFTVSNVISAFLDHLKPEFSLPANYDGRHRAPPVLKISGSAPEKGKSKDAYWNYLAIPVFFGFSSFFL